jgi:hypothetical protein
MGPSHEIMNHARGAKIKGNWIEGYDFCGRIRVSVLVFATVI